MNIYILSLLSDACDDISVLKVMLFLKTLINLLFTLVPLGAVLFLSFDLAKSVVASNIEEQRMNLSLFLKRFISLLIIFLIPTIVSLVVSLVTDEGDVGNYSKCLTVTSERIKSLTESKKNECINNYEEWDPVNNICVFVGEKNTLPKDFKVIQKREKQNVIVNNASRLNRTFPGSNSKTMMEYKQGDPKWGNIGFCSTSTDTMAGSGCGPTSLAMIITGYGNDQNATPKTVRDFLCNYGIHHSDGLSQWSEPLNKNFLSHFGLSGELMFSNNKGSSKYSAEKAKQLKDAVDQGYAVMILIPLHYVVIDKGGCPADKVYYYNPAEKDNGCVTMKQLWDKTWNRRQRCTVIHHSCGWRWAWKYKPANGTI